ncbi:hypothetical protein KR222_009203 [Zaprionus bogoriensis]|nr:hypothetical protein KR222_009203 [Zaprionus bogoriensis]
MRAVIQRVSAAKVMGKQCVSFLPCQYNCAAFTVLGELISSIGPGLCVLVGIKTSDTEADVDYLVRKILALRLFEDEGKRWQKSVKDLQLEVLCVSQFTLYHRLKGNKPDFSAAMKSEEATRLYNIFLDRLRRSHEATKVKDGKFGAYMQVHIENDGPVTLELESPQQKLSEECVDK